MLRNKALEWALSRDGRLPQRDVVALCRHVISDEFQGMVKGWFMVTSGRWRVCVCPIDQGDDLAFVIVASVSFHEETLFAFGRSLGVAAIGLSGALSRPVVMDGPQLHSVFGAPRVYPRPKLPWLDRDLMGLEGGEGKLSTVVVQQRVAIYAQKQIVAASRAWWAEMGRFDLHAVDLLVRHGEAPFSDQIVTLVGGAQGVSRDHVRVVVATLYASLKLVLVVPEDFDAASALSSAIPRAIMPYRNQLIALERCERCIDRREGVRAWIVHDHATHRFLGECPDALKPALVKLVGHCYEMMGSERVQLGGRIDVMQHKLRAEQIEVRFQEGVLFYYPQVAVKNQKYYPDPHFWSLFLVHDGSVRFDSTKEIRKFADELLRDTVQYVPPICEAAPYIKGNINRVDG